MSGLAEDHLDDAPWRAWLIRGGIALGLIALVLGTIVAVKSLKGGDDKPKRQVAKISILPDTPPPPPPPPKEEKKPEPPKDEPKQVIREEQLKPAEAPKPAGEQLKMEGAAGDGPSAFAAGTVARNYAGGAPTTGGAASPAGTAADRAQERFYANTARQLLQGEIERHLKSDTDTLTASFSIWLDKDGGIQRFELAPSGNSASDLALRAALDATSRQFKLPPPPAIALAQPMRFRLSLRPQA